MRYRPLLAIVGALVASVAAAQTPSPWATQGGSFVIPDFHCGGGPGPSGVDWLRHLEDWVERGQAPGEVVANKGTWDAAPAGASQRLVPLQAR